MEALENYLQKKNVIPKKWLYENDRKEILLTKKKRLVEIIKDLNRSELLEIFHIFKKENCSFSENTNGIFINITNTSEEVIDKVYLFINYIKDKKTELNNYDEILQKEKDKIKDCNKVNEENYDNYENYIFNKNFIHNIQENKNIELLSESEDEKKEELYFSSDEEKDMESKLCLKKKKIKYTGNKAKLMKSYKDVKDKHSLKKKNTKVKEEEEKESE
jgi:hypothetical protein